MTYLGLVSIYYFCKYPNNGFIDIDHKYFDKYISLQLSDVEFNNDIPNDSNSSLFLMADSLVFSHSNALSTEDIKIINLFREASSINNINKFYAFIAYFKILELAFVKQYIKGKPD